MKIIRKALWAECARKDMILELFEITQLNFSAVFHGLNIVIGVRDHAICRKILLTNGGLTFILAAIL